MQVEKWLDFDTNPLFALMHESIYCQVSSQILFYGIQFELDKRHSLTPAPACEHMHIHTYVHLHHTAA